MKTVDLRSDTVTQPTPAMREAMMTAPLGDDVFGDDPSVNALQDRIAAITGKEAALFMPSGTQSNLCGILAHCQRGDEYIVGQNAHTFRYEGGGAAVFGSVQPQPLTQDAQGRMVLADIAAAIKPDDPHFARTRLLCLENTWNGHVMPDAYLHAATQLARQHGLATPPWPPPRQGRARWRVCAKSLTSSTACPFASARAWVRRWARPCVVPWS